MPNDPISPAVASLLKEQNVQRVLGKDPSNRDLKTRFRRPTRSRSPSAGSLRDGRIRARPKGSATGRTNQAALQPVSASTVSLTM